MVSMPVTRADLDVATPAPPSGLGWQLVIHESNRFRDFADFVLVILLIYTGTVFPFQVCFVSFHVTRTYRPSKDELTFDLVVDILWWIDLVLNFFYTYRDSRGREVDFLPDIVRHYLRAQFWLNLVACLPADAIRVIVSLCLDRGLEDSAELVEAVRWTRLQRLTRLARLFRLMHVGRLVAAGKTLPVWKRLTSFRVLGAMNFIFGLIWVVHLLACGWYLCASLHNNFEDTWVARRVVSSETDDLAHKGPLEQWCTAMYLVVTIFTTVGFGDMSAFTVGEMVYACFTMLVGTILHTIIVGEVLTTIMSKSDTEAVLVRRKTCIEGFIQHTQVDDPDIQFQLRRWAHVLDDETHYDTEEMRLILNSSTFPQDLLNELPGHLFLGHIEHNKLITSCFSYVPNLPPRLSLFIAVALNTCRFEASEIVYQCHERACAVFLVEKGVFAHVGRARSEGGLDAAPEVWNSMRATSLFPERTTSGREKGLTKQKSRTVGSLAKMLFLQKHLSPYHLVPFGSYFGLAEVLRNCERCSTVRCESPESSVFVLKRHDFSRIVEDFPRVGMAWRSISTIHEQKRLQSLSRLTSSCRDYQHIAASRIQQHYRRIRFGIHTLADTASMTMHGARHGTGEPTPPDFAASLPRRSRHHTGAEVAEEPSPSVIEQLRLDLRSQLNVGLESLRNDLRRSLQAWHEECQQPAIDLPGSVADPGTSGA